MGSPLLRRAPGASLLACLLAILPLGWAPRAVAAQAEPAESRADPPPLPLEQNELVRVVDRPEEGELEVVIGPVELPAGLPHLRPPIQMTALPIDGWLHGFAWEIRDEGGRPLPNDLLHHVNLLEPDARELFAPIPRRVLAAGSETPPQSMPRLLGYPVESGTRILIVSMFANPTETDHRAYLHVRLPYTPRERPGLIAPRTVYPWYMDAMGPVGPKDFPLPPGRTERTWEGSPAIDGRVLALGGHVHDHAVELRLEDATSDEVLWRIAPREDESGHVVSLPTGQLWWKGGIPLRKDRRYRIVVVYDRPTGAPAPDGGMGVVGGILLAAPGQEWPALDRTDVAYVEDLTNTLLEPTRNRGHGAHGGHGHGGGGGDGG